MTHFFEKIELRRYDLLVVDDGCGKPHQFEAQDHLRIGSDAELRRLIADGEQLVAWVEPEDAGQQTHPEPKGLIARLRAFFSPW
jgi:hypothetical protein